MPKPSAARKINGIGDDAVREKTGKTWAGWLAVLDKAGAKKMSHKEIATYISEQHGCPSWWSQMITVGYEQERGLREKHQKPDGYTASVSKTLAVAVEVAFAAWHDEAIRDRWLPGGDLQIRKATAPKSLRVALADGTSVNVQFYAKGAGKCQVAVEHNKLPKQADVARVKAYWGDALGRLKAELDGDDAST